jgi:formylglycine-generating enzyme required for sulfatase activity
MGKNYRLPTEAEWERAVRHTDGREYPWGKEEPKAVTTNFQPTGLERPTAVGIFPQDTAICGAQDMAGNINEWCQTRWDDGSKEYRLPYNPNDGREDLGGGNNVGRVVKGGSYYDDKKWLRCAFRLRYHPARRYYRIGCRVVVVPHFSTTSGL